MGEFAWRNLGYKGPEYNIDIYIYICTYIHMCVCDIYMGLPSGNLTLCRWKIAMQIL